MTARRNGRSISTTQGARRSQLCFVALFTVNLALGQTMLEESNADGVADRIVLVSREQCSLSQALRYGREFLKEGGAARVSRLRLITERYQVQPPKPQTLTFEAWRRSNTEIRSLWWCMAEVLTIGKNSALLFRGAEGKVHHTVLRGTSPYSLSVGNQQFKILHFDFVRSPLGHIANVRLFVLGRRGFNASQVAEVARWAERTLRFARITVLARHEPWFALDPGFPWFHPFSHRDVPPTSESGGAWEGVRCVVSFGSLSCDELR